MARKTRPHHTLIEPLEARLVLAAIAWDGGPTGNGTDWHNPINWDGDILPADGDDVTINIAADPQITYDSGTLNLNSLTTTELLQVSGGTLSVTNTATINNTLTLFGGTIAGGTWDVTAGALRPLANSGNRITNATILGDLTLDASSARARIEGSTTFTTARLAATTTALGFDPGSSLPGNIIFEGGTGNRALVLTAAGTFTIPASRSITTANGFTGSGQIGGSFHFAGTMDLTSHGTIDFTSSTNQNLTFAAASTINTGSISVQDTRLRFSTGFTNTGTIANTGGDLELDGAWDNSGGVINITDADLELDGTFTTAALGTINRAGASTVTLTGEMDNTGETLGFDASTGSWTLLGGTLTGGTLTSADGEKLAIGTNSGNRLADLTIVGDLVLDIGSGRVRVEGSTSWGTARLSATTTAIGFEPGAILPGDVVFEGGLGNRALVLVNAGTFAIPAARSVTTAGGFTGSGQIGGSFHFSGAMDLTNEGTVDFASTTNQNLTLAAASTINSGSITGHDTRVRFSAGFVNTGTIANDGGDLELDGPWDNSGGVINVTDADLELDGAFTTAALGTINRAGTTAITLSGELDNTGDSLDFDAGTGSWTLLGGRLTGGTLTSADGERLAIGANSGNRLVDVTVVGELVLDVASGRVRIEGSTTWDTARLVASTTAIGVEPGFTLPGNVVFEGSSGIRAVTVVAAGTLTIPAGLAVYADPAFTAAVQIGGSFHFGGAMDLINEGTIELRSNVNVINSIPAATVTNTGLIMSHTAILRFPSGFENQGVIAGDGGRLDFDGEWSNASGTVNLTGADLKLDGEFATSDVGTINRTGSTEISLTGELDNTSDTLAFDAGTGSWVLAGGSVTGGTLSHADGERLAIGPNSNNMLIDVAVVGGLTLDVGAGRVQIRGTTTWDLATLAEGSTALGFEPGASVPSDVVLAGSGVIRALVLRTDGTLTIPADVTVSTDPLFAGRVQIGGSFYWSGDMDLFVEGDVLLGSTAAGSMVVRPDTLFNSGLIASTGNTVAVEPGVLLNTGTLRAQGGGTLVVDMNGAAWTNDGTLAAGPGSTVRVADDLVLGASSDVRIEINGFAASDIGVLTVGGALTLGGAMSVVGVDGWIAECVSLDCIVADSLAGSFDTVDLPVPPEGHKSFLIFVPDGQTIRFAISPESDWNSDGQLDTLDFLAFLNDWVAGESHADFNNDGRIDTLDFLAFLNSWTAGC